MPRKATALLSLLFALALASACGPVDLGSNEGDAAVVPPTEGGPDVVADVVNDRDASEADAPFVEPAITYLKASNTRTESRFGIVAMDGDTVVVGAAYESSSRTDPNDPSAPQAGAAYVFRRTAGMWKQEAYLKPSNARAGSFFGASVAIVGDRIAIGAIGESSGSTNKNDTSAPGAGAVYVFQRSGTTWTEDAYLKASSPRAGSSFGASLALVGDTLVVGAVGESSNATGVGGNANDTSAPEAGAAYVFTRGAGGWSESAYIKASNTRAGAKFGAAVTLDKTTLVVGSIRESSLARGVNGDQNDTNAPGAGAAYVFVRSGNTWVQQAYLKASNTNADENLVSWFGFALSLSDDTLAVSAPIEASSARGVNGDQNDTSAVLAGAVYLFQRTGTTWAQTAYVKAPNTKKLSLFGYSLALGTDALVVGAMTEPGSARGIDGDGTDDKTPGAGAVYTFARGAGTLTPSHYLKATNTRADAAFGYSLSRSGAYIVIGSVFETSAATGVAGNANDTSAPSAGAAYVFRL